MLAIAYNAFFHKKVPYTIHELQLHCQAGRPAFNERPEGSANASVEETDVLIRCRSNQCQSSLAHHMPHRTNIDIVFTLASDLSTQDPNFVFQVWQCGAADLHSSPMHEANTLAFRAVLHDFVGDACLFLRVITPSFFQHAARGLVRFLEIAHVQIEIGKFAEGKA